VDRGVTTFRSAATCRRFLRLRPLPTGVRINRSATAEVNSLTKAAAGRRTPKSFLFPLLAILVVACSTNRGAQSVPAEVETTINRLTLEIAAERYEKVYNEAAEQWRQEVSLENSIASFKTLRSKLGAVETRTLQSAVEQENSGGALKGRVYIVSYRTKFQNGEGMETFTLVEREGRWLLARYLVNSTALK
jgi:hypothetical protein